MALIGLPEAELRAFGIGKDERRRTYACLARPVLDAMRSAECGVQVCLPVASWLHVLSILLSLSPEPPDADQMEQDVATALCDALEGYFP